MFDPLADGMRAVAMRSAGAPALVMLCGLFSSLGPCVASRFVAVAGLSANRDRRAAVGISGAFIAGLTVVYICLGAGSSLLGRLAAFTHVVYWVVAGSLGIGGIAMLCRETPACVHERERREVRVSFGGGFMLGVSSAFVISPCCTPLLTGILAYTSQAGDPVYGALLLGAFGAGHAMPVLAAGLGASATGSILKRFSLNGAAAVVGGALMLALAGYYAVLA